MPEYVFVPGPPLPEPIKEYITVYRCPLCNRELSQEWSEFISEACCVSSCGYWYDFNAQRARIERAVQPGPMGQWRLTVIGGKEA